MRQRLAVAAIAGAISLSAYGQALASPGCNQVNAGAWNGPLQSFEIGLTIGGFDNGDKLTFRITGTGQLTLLASSGGGFISVLIVNSPGTGIFRIAPPHILFRILNDSLDPIIVTATCTPTVLGSADSAQEALTTAFLVSRINGLLLDEPGGASLRYRASSQTAPSITAMAGNGAGMGAVPALASTTAMALGAGSGFDGAAPSEPRTVRFGVSLAQLRQAARQAQAGRERMALGAGDAAPLAYETASPWEAWAEGRFTAFDDDAGTLARDGHVGVLFAGADYRVTPGLIIGALVQLDWSEDRSGAVASKLEGNGWMAGPYLSARIDDNLFLDLRAAWGRSANDLALGAIAAGFDTSRWLIKGALAGTWFHERWRFTPAAELAYLEESLEGYTDTSLTVVPGRSVALGRLQLGPEVGYRFAPAAGLLVEPFAAVRAVWDFANSDAEIVDGLVVGPGDLWARLEGGVMLLTAEGIAVRTLASWDGVGAANYSGYTLQGTVIVPLN